MEKYEKENTDEKRNDKRFWGKMVKA